MPRPLNSFEANLLNTRQASLLADGTLGAPISLEKRTSFCSGCWSYCAYNSFIPLCTGCKHSMKAEDSFLPLLGIFDLYFLMRYDR